MLKNLKKRRAQLIARGELAEAKEYTFFPVSFEMPKVPTATVFLAAFQCASGGMHRHVPRRCVVNPK